MSLDTFYSLRTNFIVFGLTGRMQAGVDRFARLFEKPDNTFATKILTDEFISAYSKISDSESRKVRRLKDFYNHKKNWKQFKVIEYKNVVLLFLLKSFYSEDTGKYSESITDFIVKIGTYKKFKNPRFASEERSNEFIKKDFKQFLESRLKDIIKLDGVSGNFFSNAWSKENNSQSAKTLFFFENDFEIFAKDFFQELDSFSIYLRHKLIHVLSYYLRNIGKLDYAEIVKLGLDNSNYKESNLNHIYTIAELIKKIIKDHKNNADSKGTHFIIDRLKNSLEIMYFRERYSGFYLVASNRDDKERKEDIEKKIEEISPLVGVDNDLKKLLELDETEYKIDEFKKGKFDTFDIENCIQKADYHLVLNKDTSAKLLKKYKEAEELIKEKKLSKTNKYYVYLPFEIQCFKLLALIQQPGLISPTYIERTMQIAYNAKLNSGCISRQVGAVVTDTFFSVKGIGWNDVPQGQTVCSLRDVRDFVDAAEPHSGFTNLEAENTLHKYKDGETFHKKMTTDLGKVENLKDNLEGRPCAYCFKTFHNAYEGENNQVHTRSLHAEENAMLQISKHGGQPLHGGNLFTTASPCELCAKKAYQLGLKNIFYIDLYPGISRDHILKGGTKPESNPSLYQFQGAIGRGFLKLFEPFMSIKDETTLRSGIEPTKKKVNDEVILKVLKEKAKELKINEDFFLDKTLSDVLSLISVSKEKSYETPN